MNITIKPNFFIVGAAKCGTTSLANTLNSHPDIFIPKVKEPMFFIPDIGVKTLDDYLSLYSNAKETKLRGDASTGYLFDEGSPSKLFEFNKDAKIIIVLRNPIDMMFSFWQYMTVSGNEQLSFIDALRDIDRRKLSNYKESCVGWYANYLYLERASYADQIKRYLNTFPANQIKVILFEELTSKPDDIINDLLKFLAVNHSRQPLILKRANESGTPRSKILKMLIDKRKIFIGQLIPLRFKTPLKQMLMRINTSSTKRKITFEERRVAAGMLKFDQLVPEIESLIGRKISSWKL